MEIFHVGEEAEEAQKEIHEQAYRESAIKKQIELLQQQLDEMHPENISDVRRFETKIQESGMNEEAKKEAEKVLNRMKQEEQARCNCGHSNYCIGRMYSIEMACHQHLKETLPPCLQKEIEKLEKK